jgi:hypothetical protein
LVVAMNLRSCLTESKPRRAIAAVMAAAPAS